MVKEVITSTKNNRVKTLVKLRQKKLLREKLGQFLIEGYKELSEALKSGVKVIELYHCPTFFRDDSYIALLEDAEAKGANVVEVTEDVFKKISHREGPDGLLGIGETWTLKLEDLKLSKNPVIMIVERMEKPGNLGNVIRSAEAAGADALIVSEPMVDVFNPNVVRASLGMVFSLPIAVSDNESVLKFLEENKITAFAATPHAESIYWDADMSGPAAILVGTEKGGLSDFWMKRDSVQRIKIPLEGKQGDSLNASVASALMLYEALRQRKG